MTDFWATSRPRSRKSRVCPECGTEIPAGAVYVRHAGKADGDMIHAFMCETCDAFSERYLATLRLHSSVNWDEATYRFGDLINEAAEFVGYQDDGEPPARRDAMMAMFDDIDASERAYQAEERERRKAAKERQAAFRAGAGHPRL